MEPKTRLNVYMTEKTKKRVEAMAKKLGRRQSDTAVLAIETGLDLLELSTSKRFAAVLAQNPTMIEELQRMVYESELIETNGEAGVEPDRKEA